MMWSRLTKRLQKGIQSKRRAATTIYLSFIFTFIKLLPFLYGHHPMEIAAIVVAAFFVFLLLVAAVFFLVHEWIKPIFRLLVKSFGTFRVYLKISLILIAIYCHTGATLMDIVGKSGTFLSVITLPLSFALHRSAILCFAIWFVQNKTNAKLPQKPVAIANAARNRPTQPPSLLFKYAFQYSLTEIFCDLIDM